MHLLSKIIEFLKGRSFYLIISVRVASSVGPLCWNLSDLGGRLEDSAYHITSYNAFSEPRPRTRLELVEASKISLIILLHYFF